MAVLLELVTVDNLVEPLVVYSAYYLVDKLDGTMAVDWAVSWVEHLDLMWVVLMAAP